MRDLIGQRATREHFDEVVDDDRDLVVDGRVVFKFRKRVIDDDHVRAARIAWGDVADFAPPSVTRRAAAGAPDLAEFRRFERFRDAVELIPQTSTTALVRYSDGRVLRQPMSNPVLSFLAGFGVDRFTKTARPNMLTHRWPDRWALSVPFFQAIDRVLAREMPDVHARHRERCALHPRWTIPGCALSTATININYESRYHLDTGDFRDGFSTLSVVELGSYSGGLFVIPEHRVAVDVRAGDVLICQSHKLVHGNTELRRGVGAHRVSFVTYLKHALGEARNRLADPANL